MSIIERIDDNIKDFLEEKKNFKVITTSGKNGVYHGSRIDYIEVVNDKTIRFPEYLEGSVTNKNLIYSLWFNRYVEIVVGNENGEEYTITGTPVRSYIEGELFEKKYIEAQKRFEGKVDLSTVWEISVTGIERTDLLIVSAEEQKLYPIVNHLDRIAKG